MRVLNITHKRAIAEMEKAIAKLKEEPDYEILSNFMDVLLNEHGSIAMIVPDDSLDNHDDKLDFILPT